MGLRHALNIASTQVLIFTDSKAAFQNLDSTQRPLDNIGIVTAILDVATSIRSTGANIGLIWIPSHIGLTGNEKADAAANTTCNKARVDFPT